MLRAFALQSLRLPLRVFCFLSASLARENLVLSTHDERGASLRHLLPRDQRHPQWQRASV